MAEKKTLNEIANPKVRRNLAILRREFEPKGSGNFFNPTYSAGRAAPDESKFGAFKIGKKTDKDQTRK